MESFSNYSFNFSHSFSYAALAFQTMFMSTYFPGYWYASVLNESFGKLGNIVEQLKERALKIKVVQPQLSNLYENCKFIINDNKDPNVGTIYIGLSRVKGIGDKAASALNTLFDIKFKSFDEFINHLTENKLTAINKRALITMANIGMFDSFKLSRQEARAKILLIKEKNNYRVVTEHLEGKRPKYRLMTIEEAMEKDAEDNKITDTFFYISEVEALGIGFSNNPSVKLNKKLMQLRMNPKIKDSKDYDAGLVSKILEKTTKTGKKYFFLQIDSLSHGNMDIFLWEQDIKKIGLAMISSIDKYDMVVFCAKKNSWGSGDTYNMKALIKVEGD